MAVPANCRDPSSPTARLRITSFPRKRESTETGWAGADIWFLKSARFAAANLSCASAIAAKSFATRNRRLEKEFGTSLSGPDVFIIDPCTGTGNFIVNLLRRMPRRDLPRMYREQLFANEVMLLPYYIAALNIEHAYYELTGTYEPFEGLCFVDTLDLAEGSQHQLGFMTEKNAERVERQRKAPITVVIGTQPTI